MQVMDVMEAMDVMLVMQVLEVLEVYLQLHLSVTHPQPTQCLPYPP